MAIVTNNNFAGLNIVPDGAVVWKWRFVNVWRGYCCFSIYLVHLFSSTTSSRSTNITVSMLWNTMMLMASGPTVSCAREVIPKRSSRRLQKLQLSTGPCGRALKTFCSTYTTYLCPFFFLYFLPFIFKFSAFFGHSRDQKCRLSTRAFGLSTFTALWSPSVLCVTGFTMILC